MYDHTFSKLANHQIRHQATHKVTLSGLSACDCSDCWSICNKMFAAHYKMWFFLSFSLHLLFFLSLKNVIIIHSHIFLHSNTQMQIFSLWASKVILVVLTLLACCRIQIVLCCSFCNGKEICPTAPLSRWPHFKDKVTGIRTRSWGRQSGDNHKRAGWRWGCGWRN